MNINDPNNNDNITIIYDENNNCDLINMNYKINYLQLPNPHINNSANYIMNNISNSNSSNTSSLSFSYSPGQSNKHLNINNNNHNHNHTNNNNASSSSNTS